MQVLGIIIKVFVLCIGLLLLVGGGLCGAIMVAEIGSTGGGFPILLAAVVVAVVGWVIVRAMMKSLRGASPDDSSQEIR